MSKVKQQIVFLNRSYWPDIEATGQLLTDLCVALSDDYDVHVVCGQPNSPERGIEFKSQGVETKDGVTIHRLRHRQHDKARFYTRYLNLVSFYKEVDRYLHRSDLRPDAVISETDPFLLPLAGARFAKARSAKHLVYLQDIYPDIAEAIGKCSFPGLGTAIRHRLQTTYRQADRVVVLGRCMRDRLSVDPWRIDPSQVSIISNWADCNEIRPISHELNDFRKERGWENDYVVMHSGNMGLTQRLELLIQAASQPEWPTKAKLVLVGNGALRGRLIRQAKQLGLFGNRIQFLNYQPRRRLSESLSAADLHVVSMHEDITGCLCPSKMYGIMAAGRGIIAVGDPRTDLCQVVKRRHLGWTVPAGSAQAIAKAVANAVSSDALMSNHPESFASPLQRNRRARQTAIQCFDRHVVGRQYAELLASLLETPLPVKSGVTPAPHFGRTVTDVPLPVS